MKLLYVTTIGSTMGFFKLFIKQLLDEGHTVDIATNENNSKVSEYYKELGCAVYAIDTSRSPLNKGNVNAINQIKKIVEDNKYDIVHCHTPIAAACTRIACRKARKAGTKVFYTAHGFHFFKGAPLLNWLVYYPVERICSHFTDVLITINKEDYTLAKSKMKAKRIVYVPGVGIDLNKFSTTVEFTENKRSELGIPDDATLLISIGELSQRKNHETVIRAVADMENVYYIIAGQGAYKERLQDIIDNLNLTGRVQLLGYRKDIRELCNSADIFVMPSLQEGLPVSIMEAMAMGLPCVVSEIRGNTDLIDENGGDYFNPKSVEECKKAIKNVLSADIEKMSAYNKEKVKNFSVEKINKQLREEYEKIKCSEKIR